MRARSMLTLALAAISPSALAQLAVTSTSPGLNALNVSFHAPIVISFDRPVNPATIAGDNFWVFSRWAGMVGGTTTLSPDARVLTFTPSHPWHAGDAVMVILSHDLRAADGTFLRQAGYTLTFTTRALPTTGTFQHVTTFSDRSPNNAQTRIYGGLACDLNRDRWLDLTMINEVSADLRVFLSRADGTMLFQPFLTPPTPIPYESSPNEPGDFNRDGFIDIITTSNFTNQLTIAFGRGDGTFNPPTIITMPSYPRGNAVLDYDGDGDLDIAVANNTANNLSLLTNNGSGVFGAPLNVSTNGTGPYGLVAADMNNDAILDLVVGHVSSQNVSVLRGNGNGTFTLASTRPIGGANWVIAAGDLNGDGRIDIVGANSGSSNGSVLLGNGNGTLQAAVTRATSGHTVGTELADYDGDGDLDWILACFGGGRWHRYANNGAGVMTEIEQFIAPNNPACSVSADFDNDGDIDLALLDEIADVILLKRNVSGACSGDVNCDLALDGFDVEAQELAVGGVLTDYCRPDPDFNGDLALDGFDVEAVELVVGGGPCPS